ncbi:MAG: Uma2 family endonuclease [Desulfobacterales bacterium]|nr:Uma2 family endonuclease [Desulfobacterales bacterium]
MPSLNHSYICLQILKQLISDDSIEPLPELTLDIANGLTPDISVFQKGRIQPNFFHDIPKFQETPVLAIEVISSSQTIQAMLEKAGQLVKAGVSVVWTVEPHTKSIFVTTETEEKLFHDEVVESKSVKVDFTKVFNQESN